MILLAALFVLVVAIAVQTWRDRERPVSRNQPAHKDSPSWEQDVPMPECFDEMDESDL